MLSHFVFSDPILHATETRRNLFIGTSFILGFAVYLHFAFTVIWAADAAWWLIAPRNRAARPNWLNTAIHSYLAWMFVNGAIVFPQGPTRWIAAALAVVLMILKLATK